MLKPSLKLSRLPLRSKLLLLAALPLLPLVAASYLFVNDSIDQRASALGEQAEIGRIESASGLASALIVERDAFQQSNTLGVRLRLTRERTDAALAAYRSVVEGDAGRDATADAIETEINWVRSSLGDVDSMVAMQQEARTSQDGEAAEVFQRLDQLVDLAIAEVQVTPGAIQTSEGATNARSVLLLTEFTAGLHSELVQYVAIGEADATLARYGARSDAAAYSDQVDATTERILALDNAEFASRFQSEVLDSDGYRLVGDLRDRAFAATVNPEIAPSASYLPTFTPMFGAVHTLEDDLIAASSDQATVTANRALYALGGTVLGAGLFALLTLVLVVALFRSIRRPLLSLTDQSRQIAKHQLPNAVAQIRELGGDAEVEMPEPIQAESDDEVGELVDAFNQLHSTAIQLAAEQAASRRTVSEMFVNLGRRNQKILMRLLASLEKLEHNERDPELLQELFKVDHLATRMRRNAESLLVLAGAKTSRSFGQAVPVADVVRSALSEVEDYERVSVDDEGNALINGKAVADIGHLLAELIENALMFSPPTSSVEVLIRRGPDGLMITVGDRGIGLSAEELKANNQRILDAARLTETPSRFLGLYVVGRLAHRHGLKVELLNGVPSGLIARIRFAESVYQAIGESPEGPHDSEPLVEESADVDAAPSVPSLDGFVPAPALAQATAPAPAQGQAPIEAPTSIPAPAQVQAPAPAPAPAPSQDPVPAAAQAIAQSPAPATSQADGAFPVGPAPLPSAAPMQSPTPPAPSPVPAPAPAPAPAQAPLGLADHAIQHTPPAPAQSFAPPAPAHRRSDPPTSAPVPTGPGMAGPTDFVLSKRTPTTVPSTQHNDLRPPAPVTHRVNPNQNLSGFQRATASEPSQAEAGVDRRRPQPAPEVQPPVAPPTQPTQMPAGPAPGGFAVTRRVPGASSLTRKSDQPTTAARPEEPITTPETAPSVAARFGANLAGFQRGVQRADSPAPAPSETVEPSPEHTAPNGELS
ncbi:MAG: ATP-binding protein [Acidimicrobiales bacterium]